MPSPALKIAYDPVAAGSKCSVCPLGPDSPFVDRTEFPWIPVPSEINPRAVAAAIAEAPGEKEEMHGGPLKGPSGRELMEGINAIGWQRDDLSYLNTVSCRPPKNEFEKLLHQVDVENRRRKREGKKQGRAEDEIPLVPTPMECCRPRLLKEMAQYSNFIPLGAFGSKALMGPDVSIMSARGRPVPGVFDAKGKFWGTDWEGVHGEKKPIPEGCRPVRVIPTLHPAFIKRMSRWRGPFRADLARARRWFNGQMGWKEPTIKYQPTPAQLREFLWRGKYKDGTAWQHLTYDVETDGLEPLRALLRCIAIGTHEEVMVVGLLSIDGETHLYPDHIEEREILKVLRDFFTNPPCFVSGWNIESYDRQIMEENCGYRPGLVRTVMPDGVVKMISKIIDGILAHRLKESELPHSLGHVVSVYSDAPDWKEAHTAVNARTDEELHHYCGIDVGNTHPLIMPFVEAVVARKQEHLLPIDHAIQSMCVGMHRNGLPIDQGVRAKHEDKTRGDRIKHRLGFQEKSGKKVNPGSVQQLVSLLYEDWKLPIKGWTDLGDPSTKDEILREYIIDPNVPKQQKEALKELRLYRRATKLLGTYIIPCRFEGYTEEMEDEDYGEESFDDELGAMVKKLNKDGEGKLRFGLVWVEDGRLHANFNGAAVVTGRLSHTNPNTANWPETMRDMIVAPPGFVFVGADLDQGEVRAATGITGCKKYLDVFKKEKGDPHAVTATLIFGERFLKAPGSKDEKNSLFARLRKLGKTIGFASQYNAASETVYKSVTKAEDEKSGELIFADLSKSEIHVLHQNWKDGVPEYLHWWDDLVTVWQNQGYIEEPILKRRRDCLDGEGSDNLVGELASFQCQAAVASVMAEASIEIMEQLPFGKFGPGTGIVLQTHDDLKALVPEKEAEWTRDLMARAMNRSYPDRLPGVTFTAAAKIGRDLAHV